MAAKNAGNLPAKASRSRITKRKKSVMTFERKVELIKSVESGVPRIVVCAKYQGEDACFRLHVWRTVRMKKDTAWRDMMAHPGGGNGPRGRNMPHDGEEKGKMFVGGLSWETTQESLQRYFGQYGEVIDCVVMKNSETGRSRGFGFVTFADPNKVDSVLKNGPHELDGRTIDPKACNPRSMQKQKRNGNWPKVFLGGLPSNLTETDLRNFFSRFGGVMEVVIMFDQEKKKSRGFGFLSFETEEAVDRAVAEHFVNINGKQVEIKKAEPRDASKAQEEGGQWGAHPDNQWGMPVGPPGMPGLNNGMGPGNMGPPLGPPLGPHNSQMGGHMGTQGMVQGPYQGWGTPPQQQGYPPQGYGAPQGPGGYQGWGAGQQLQQWGAPSYGSPGGQQYGSFGPMEGGTWGWTSPTSPSTPQPHERDPYGRNAPLSALMTGAPGAPSPNLAAAAGPQPGGKASADYSTWGQFNYNQMSGESSAAAAAAAAFTHGRGYNDGGAPGPAPAHQGEIGTFLWEHLTLYNVHNQLFSGAARCGSEGVIGQEGGDPHTNGRPSPSNAQPFSYIQL